MSKTGNNESARSAFAAITIVQPACGRNVICLQQKGGAHLTTKKRAISTRHRLFISNFDSNHRGAERKKERAERTVLAKYIKRTLIRPVIIWP